MIGLHVLFVYAFKRLSDTVDRDEAVFEEIQRRANLVPPTQRQAAIDAMVLDRDNVTSQVYVIKQKEEAFSNAFNRVCWICWWIIAAGVLYFFGWDVTFWVMLIGSLLALIISFFIG